MRGIRYLAATAAAVVAPLALALPASAATTDLPIVGDLGGILGGSDGHHHGGGYDTGGTVTVYVSGSTSTGNVSLLVDGNGVPARMGIVLSSAGLNVACTSNSLQGATAVADRNGHFDLTASAQDCVPGTYRIDASEQSTPYQTFSDDATIN